MAENTDSSAPSASAGAPLSPKNENVATVKTRISELTESRTELTNRIQSLKQDLQNWRTRLDTQVKTYRDELTGLKQSLNSEVEQLSHDFQDLRTSLQQQQEELTASLRSLGLGDVGKPSKVAANDNVEEGQPISNSSGANHAESIMAEKKKENDSKDEGSDAVEASEENQCEKTDD